VTIEMQKL